MVVDKELCREVAARIRVADMEGLFNMETWGTAIGDYPNECNTTACAAGHTLMAAGYRPVYSQYFSLQGYRNGTDWVESDFARAAANLLGVSDVGIFYSTQLSAEQVGKYFDLLADGWHWREAHNHVLTMVS